MNPPEGRASPFLPVLAQSIGNVVEAEMRRHVEEHHGGGDAVICMDFARAYVIEESATSLARTDAHRGALFFARLGVLYMMEGRYGLAAICARTAERISLEEGAGST